MRRSFLRRQPYFWAIFAFVLAGSFLVVEHYQLLKQLILFLGLVFFFLRLMQELRLNLAQSHFIAAVTHELRTPVTSLQLILEALDDSTINPATKKEFEADLRVEVRRLKTLVDQVLETTRFEHLAKPIQLEPISLYGLLQSCLDELSTVLKAKSVHLDLSAIPVNLKVYAHRKLLKTSLCNVIENALKYSHELVNIKFAVQEQKNHIVLCISDDGLGLASKDLKKIFRRFYRAQNSSIQAKTGTGLGLYFTKLCLQAQKAKIWVRSKGINQGSDFYIRIQKYAVVS